MIGHLWKLALVVALSHGYRVVGRTFGPRWAGLITALPCSTAVALMGGGTDRGVDYAVQMAGACWVGLAGASALPLAFATAVIAGWSWFSAILLAVSAYFAIMMGVSCLAQFVGGTIPAAFLTLTLATVLAHRLGEPRGLFRQRVRVLSDSQAFLLRTIVPVVCLATVIAMGERLGPDVAGYLGTFPGVTLTTLLLTNLEAGPVPAVRMARALPMGNWAMVAFLASFDQVAPGFGLLAGLGFGYVAALICLLSIARMANPPIWTTLRAMLLARRKRIRPDPSKISNPTLAWPRNPRRFSPRIEVIFS